MKGTPSQTTFHDYTSTLYIALSRANCAASAMSRQILVYPSLSLSAGDYLVFHMDHQGVSVDAEMQVVLTYTPS